MQKDTIFTVAYVRTEEDKSYRGAIGFYTLEEAIARKDIFESYGWDVQLTAHIEEKNNPDNVFARYKITAEKM